MPGKVCCRPVFDIKILIRPAGTRTGAGQRADEKMQQADRIRILQHTENPPAAAGGFSAKGGV